MNTSLEKRKANFIEKARKIHGDKYDYSKVEYVNSETKVCIICPKHGEFWCTPHNHLKGRRCKYCYYEQETLTTEEFIKKAKEVHGDKYDYSMTEYLGGKKKVYIICHEKDYDGVEHGGFWVFPRNHLRGDGCSKCFHQSKIITTKEFVTRCNEIHKNKFDYSKVDMEHRREDGKVCIICPEHGEFWQNPYSHLFGKGCFKCQGLNLSNNDWIKRFQKIHGNKYDYSKVEYTNNYTKVCIICPKHGEFWQTPSKHMRGEGCPKCKSSHLENTIINFLEKENIPYIYQANKKDLNWLGGLTLDFYLPQYNIAIECQGKQHFEAIEFFGGNKGLEETQERDKRKLLLCGTNNISLHYLNYNDDIEVFISRFKNILHN